MLTLAVGALFMTAAAQDPRLEAARKEGKVVWYTSLALPSAEKVAKLFVDSVLRKQRKKK